MLDKIVRSIFGRICIEEKCIELRRHPDICCLKVVEMYCKKHKTIHQGQCYECEKEEMNKPIDWNKIRDPFFFIYQAGE